MKKRRKVQRSLKDAGHYTRPLLLLLLLEACCNNCLWLKNIIVRFWSTKVTLCSFVPKVLNEEQLAAERSSTKQQQEKRKSCFFSSVLSSTQLSLPGFPPGGFRRAEPQVGTGSRRILAVTGGRLAPPPWLTNRMVCWPTSQIQTQAKNYNNNQTAPD